MNLLRGKSSVTVDSWLNRLKAVRNLTFHGPEN